MLFCEHFRTLKKYINSYLIRVAMVPEEFSLVMRVIFQGFNFFVDNKNKLLYSSLEAGK